MGKKTIRDIQVVAGPFDGNKLKGTLHDIATIAETTYLALLRIDANIKSSFTGEPKEAVDFSQLFDDSQKIDIDRQSEILRILLSEKYSAPNKKEDIKDHLLTVWIYMWLYGSGQKEIKELPSIIKLNLALVKLAIEVSLRAGGVDYFISNRLRTSASIRSRGSESKNLRNLVWSLYKDHAKENPYWEELSCLRQADFIKKDYDKTRIRLSEEGYEIKVRTKRTIQDDISKGKEQGKI